MGTIGEPREGHDVRLRGTSEDSAAQDLITLYHRLLIELNADLDPVELYVERQYEWILRRMRHAYEKHLNNLRGGWENAKGAKYIVTSRILADIETNYDVPPRPFTVAQLKKGLNLLQSQEFEEAFGVL